MIFRVFLDANVLIGARNRDAILPLAAADCFDVRWSAAVLNEVDRHLLQRITAEQRAALYREMEWAFPDALVELPAALGTLASVVNPKDQHVAAAAIVGGCDLVVTDDQKHLSALVGAGQRRLDVLAAWHEAPDLYSEREQAALALTEEITRISAGGVSDEVWSLAQLAFDEQDIATLIMAICAINAWNRIAISTHLALPAQRSEQEQ